MGNSLIIFYSTKNTKGTIFALFATCMFQNNAVILHSETKVANESCKKKKKQETNVTRDYISK